MDNYDVFQTVKSIFYMGNYELAYQEVKSTDINEEDLSQVAKKYFYIFLCFIEDNNVNEINNLLTTLKDHPEDSIKIYYKVFYMYFLYYYKKKYMETTLDKLYNDSINVKQMDPIFFPAIYIISLILLSQKDYKRFLLLAAKYEQYNEILALKFYLFFSLNKLNEMEITLKTMSLIESDSVLTQICSVIYEIYSKNNFEYGLKTLSNLTQSFKSSFKIYNFIGVVLMAKGDFEKSYKILTQANDIFQKVEQSNKDYHCILSNIITCLRYQWKIDEIKEYEETLAKLDPDNPYFEKCRYFDEEIEKVKI